MHPSPEFAHARMDADQRRADVNRRVRRARRRREDQRDVPRRLRRVLRRLQRGVLAVGDADGQP